MWRLTARAMLDMTQADHFKIVVQADARRMRVERLTV